MQRFYPGRKVYVSVTSEFKIRFFYANKVLHPSSSLITSLVVGRSSGFVLPNESSQGTIGYLSYLIVNFMRKRKFSDAHFTKQYAKTVHVHLEEKIKY